jgi:hypothetical protein
MRRFVAGEEEIACGTAQGLAVAAHSAFDEAFARMNRRCRLTLHLSSILNSRLRLVTLSAAVTTRSSR